MHLRQAQEGQACKQTCADALASMSRRLARTAAVWRQRSKHKLIVLARRANCRRPEAVTVAQHAAGRHADRAAALQPPSTHQGTGLVTALSPPCKQVATKPCAQSVQRVHAYGWSIRAHSKMVSYCSAAPFQVLSRCMPRSWMPCRQQPHTGPQATDHRQDKQQAAAMSAPPSRGRQPCAEHDRDGLHTQHTATCRILRWAVCSCCAACAARSWQVRRVAPAHERAQGRTESESNPGVCVFAHAPQSPWGTPAVCAGPGRWRGSARWRRSCQRSSRCRSAPPG